MSEQQTANWNWNLLALAGAGAAALYAIRAASKSRSRPGAFVGAHARLVPTIEARQQAQWTRQAHGHSTESKG